MYGTLKKTHHANCNRDVGMGERITNLPQVADANSSLGNVAVLLIWSISSSTAPSTRKLPWAFKHCHGGTFGCSFLLLFATHLLLYQENTMMTWNAKMNLLPSSERPKPFPDALVLQLTVSTTASSQKYSQTSSSPDRDVVFHCEAVFRLLSPHSF